MLLDIMRKVPFVQSLVFFPKQNHKIAARKFTVLWLLSSSPVLLAILLSPIPAGEMTVCKKLLGKLLEAISVSELYIYAASFIAPVLYIIYERYQSIELEEPFKKKFKETISQIFYGYELISLLAAIVLFLTVAAYSAIKAGSADFNKSFLSYLISRIGFWVYIYALFCWYLSILDATSTGGDFVRENRDTESGLKRNFGSRLDGRG